MAQLGNILNTASSVNTNGVNGGTNMQDADKQQRMELLTYTKAHFDLIAVTLLIAYLGYSIYKMKKNK